MVTKASSWKRHDSSKKLAGTVQNSRKAAKPIGCSGWLPTPTCRDWLGPTYLPVVPAKQIIAHRAAAVKWWADLDSNQDLST